MTTKSKPASKPAAPSTGGGDITNYNANLLFHFGAMCDALRREIDSALPKAASKIWHGAPVWFLEDYPVVGYSIKAKQVSLLFWNGKALDEPSLKPVGKHFAAEMTFADVSELDRAAIRRCLVKAGKNIFKDYASLRAKSEAKANKQPKPAP